MVTNNRQGIVFVICSMTTFAIQDVLIKLLSVDVSMFQILFMRSITGITLIIIYLKVTGKAVVIGTAYPLLSTLRGLLFFCAYSAFYFAQSKVPIANATVLFLVSPFFITIMSILVFNSSVGIYRWVAMAVGFSGVIFVSQPQLGQFNNFYFLPVFTAFAYSISMMIVKHTAEKDSVFQQVIFMYAITAVLTGVIGLTIGDGRFNTEEFSGYRFLIQAWRFDDLGIVGSVLVVGVIGTLAFILLNNAYRISDPATIAPFEYTGLLAAILGGYLFWGDIPHLHETFGMALIVGAGLFLFYREQIRGTETTVDQPLR